MKKTKKLLSMVVVLSATVMFASVAQAAHYHWHCNVNNFLSAQYGNLGDAAYAGGVHAQKYAHKANVTYGGCNSSW